MTDDRDFKRVVRARAAETGERYSTVRQRLEAETADTDLTSVEAISDTYNAVLDRMRSAYFRDDDMLAEFLIAVIAGGNVLFESTSGVGRTILTSALASAVGASSTSIDGSADPTPDDIDATTAGVILVNDVHEASKKFRSRLLHERMIPADFLVVATHSPGVDLAQNDGDFYDAFLASFDLPLPTRAAEEKILRSAREGLPWRTLPSITSWSMFRALPQACRSVEIPDDVTAHVLDIVEHARQQEATPARISPRASVSLAQLAGAAAAADGRDVATVADVDRMTPAALRHRATATSFA